MLALIVIALAVWTREVTEACQAQPNVKVGEGADTALVRKTTTPEDIDAATMACLKDLNVSKDAVKSIDQGDLQCIVKYAWTQPDSSAKPFLKKATDYKDVFDFKEPESKGAVKINETCTKTAAGKKSSFFLTLWYCLQYCEQICPEQTDKSYPVKFVSCGEGKGLGCAKKQVCTCTDGTNSCGAAKEVTFKEMVLAYKESCLNCKNKRTENPANPLNVCVKGTEPEVYSKTPRKAFANYKILKAANPK